MSWWRSTSLACTSDWSPWVCWAWSPCPGSSPSSSGQHLSSVWGTRSQREMFQNPLTSLLSLVPVGTQFCRKIEAYGRACYDLRKIWIAVITINKGGSLKATVQTCITYGNSQPGMRVNTRYINLTKGKRNSHSSGAEWESRWPSWAVRPNELSGFRGRKAMLLNHASALVAACP